jgi:hypothetical protein
MILHTKFMNMPNLLTLFADSQQGEVSVGGIIFLLIIVFVVYKFFFSSSKTSSRTGGEYRSFTCDHCGSHYWIVTDFSTYDDPVGYNYKEWLTCAKCGDKTTNDKRI